jgi:hypothetical protein
VQSISLKTVKEYVDNNLYFDFQEGCFRRKTTLGGCKIGDRAGYITGSGYSIIGVNYTEYFEHNLVWFYFKGAFPPEGLEIDHRDRNRSYNHPDNLRLGTRSDNNANMELRSDNKAGFRGVHFNKEKQKYCAQVTKNKKTKSLGYFATAEEAAKAVAEARDRLLGEFAYHPKM